MRISTDKGDNNMSITIKRDTGFTGMGSKVQIKINGEKVASIKYNEQVDIEIPEIEARLKVTQSGMKSNEIKVKDGDIIKITTTSFNRISMILMSIVIIVTNFIPNLTYKLITFTFLIILLVIGLLSIEGFHIQVMTQNDNYKE